MGGPGAALPARGVPVVLEGRGPASPLAAEDFARLQAWARTRGLVVEAPRSAPATARAVRWEAGEEVERALARARDGWLAQDAAATDRALATAAELLDDARELPHAAFLRAELERLCAARYAALEPKDPARAAAHARRANALDGGRAVAIGEVPAPPEPKVSFAVAADETVALRLDGIAVAAGPLAAAAGTHHLAAYQPSSGALVWAGWVDVREGAVVGPALPPPPPCSQEDLVLFATQDAHADTHCPAWLLARGHGATLAVARCSAERCGPFTSVGSAAPREVGHRWVPWALAGAAAVGVTAAILAATAAAAQPPPAPPFTGGDVTVSGVIPSVR